MKCPVGIAGDLSTVERAMKIQEVILRAMAQRINWWQAAEIIGISDRSLRRGKPSPKRVPLKQVEEVLQRMCCKNPAGTLHLLCLTDG
jgi:hypothetical protein